eukprot:14894481-Heterocapsa_arctica.AAC.1
MAQSQTAKLSILSEHGCILSPSLLMAWGLRQTAAAGERSVLDSAWKEYLHQGQVIALPGCSGLRTRD